MSSSSSSARSEWDRLLLPFYRNSTVPWLGAQPHEAAWFSRERHALWAVHVPKTGGTALASFLTLNFCEHCQAKAWVPYPRSHVCKCSFISARGASLRHFEHTDLHAQFTSCVKMFQLTGQQSGRRCILATTVREPVSRAISQWKHCRSEFMRSPNATTCSHGGARPAADLSSVDALVEFSVQPISRNAQTRHLLPADRGRWSRWDGGRAHEAASAIELLEDPRVFGFVAPTSELAGLACCIARAFGSLGGQWVLPENCTGARVNLSASAFDRRLRVHNVRALRSQAESEGLDGRALPPGAAALIRGANQLDLRVYRSAAALYQSRCAVSSRSRTIPTGGTP